MPSEYSTVGGGGAIKLKGAKDAGIDKKRKKKKPRPSSTTPEPSKPTSSDPNALSTALAEEDANLRNGTDEPSGVLDRGEHDGDKPREARREGGAIQKTAAELRYEEMRRKRLDERLKREGIKTHKERVEELNKYLSNLSEHHDMYVFITTVRLLGGEG